MSGVHKPFDPLQEWLAPFKPMPLPEVEPPEVRDPPPEFEVPNRNLKKWIVVRKAGGESWVTLAYMKADALRKAQGEGFINPDEWPSQFEVVKG